MAIKLTGLNSGLDTDSIVKELMSAHSLKLTKIQNKKTKNTWTQDKWKELNKKIYALYTGDLSKAKTAGSYKTKSATSSNEDAVKVTATNSASAGSHTVEVNELASAQYVTGAKVTGITSTTDKLGFSSGTITITGSANSTSSKKVELKVDENTTASDFIAKCKEAGLNASFDTTQNRFFISSSTSGAEQAFTIDDGASGENLKKIGLGNITVEKPTGSTDAAGDGSSPSVDPAKSSAGIGEIKCSNSEVTLVKAQDAEIVLDGAKLTCSTNEPQINGLKLTLKEKTTSVATVTVSNDTQAVYDMVKNFIKSYNDVLSAMNTAYYADSSKGYDPLTDEEKEAMTDDQIEKWETKIQDSLLRRDSTLGSLLTSVKSIMSTPTVVKDKDGNVTATYPALSSLGILTSSDYTEKGLLHIQGDADDSTYSDKTNKLMAMIEEDPDMVANIVQGAASRLYETMSDKMKSTTLSSALTFYNDKQLDKYNTQYEAEIKKMETKLADLESKYYSQFTAMETAMAKLNSQQSSLASLLG